jgi:hypothetical protein
MTIKELIKELKKYPANMKVARIQDWDNSDEEGRHETEEISGMIVQRWHDDQFGIEVTEELMLY